MTFPANLREKLFLWCDRHCCLCRKQCDVFIELHHIESKKRGGPDTEDNAIPLCFDCHAKVGHYNSEHPKGAKYLPGELTRRRDQIYDEFTQHLVPALDYRIDARAALPDAGFFIAHVGGTPPVNVAITVDPYIDFERCTDFIDRIYQGQELWNLNPQKAVIGHFRLPERVLQSTAPVIVGVNVIVHDCLERAHPLLPLTYVYDSKIPGWFLDPFDAATSARRLKAEWQEA